MDFHANRGGSRIDLERSGSAPNRQFRVDTTRQPSGDLIGPGTGEVPIEDQFRTGTALVQGDGPASHAEPPGANLQFGGGIARPIAATHQDVSPGQDRASDDPGSRRW